MQFRTGTVMSFFMWHLSEVVYEFLSHRHSSCNDLQCFITENGFAGSKKVSVSYLKMLHYTYWLFLLNHNDWDNNKTSMQIMQSWVWVVPQAHVHEENYYFADFWHSSRPVCGFVISWQKCTDDEVFLCRTCLNVAGFMRCSLGSESHFGSQ